jgi:uncharacterized membrane protein YfcA
MFDVYLPIAEMSVNVLTIFGMGAAVGFLSGMFGVGGGFLITPLLIFSGVPPAVAVATGVNQIVGASVSGAIAQWRRGNVDVKMGTILLLGGFAGSIIGVALFRLLRQLGQADLIISLSYVVFLGIVGIFMLVESIRAMRQARQPVPASVRRRHHTWVHGLPLKMRFRRSKLYISAIPGFVIGALVGLLAAIMGVGGGFLMVPAMIYLLRMPTAVVVGTSLFQIIFVASGVTIMHALLNHTVDVVLACTLMLGGVFGVHYGGGAGRKLRGEQLRALLALLVLAVCARLMVQLVLPPSEFFTVVPMHDQPT